MDGEKVESLVKQVEDLLARLPKDYPERFQKIEKLISSFVPSFANLLLIMITVDKEKYINLLGKEKFEELRMSLSDLVTELSSL
ncbi:MAG: hypothetical protein B6U77_03080 [Candidatus Hecatellales archaeon ex4484_218]|nr:MAG: hypothetical protein B6U77_03080 [Candidatus Hecatellales archaeon ex4484_218]